MRKAINVILALALLPVLGCGPQPATIAPVSVATAAPILSNNGGNAMPIPGSNAINRPWNWIVQGAPNAELLAADAEITTIDGIDDYMKRHGFVWKDDYDISDFRSPNDVAKLRSTVCTGYARFWIYELNRFGVKAEFVAIYTNDRAHAVAIYRDPKTDRYKLTSNQFAYDTLDLGPDFIAALTRTAQEFYPKTEYTAGWHTIEVHDPESGQVRFVIKTPDSTSSPTPAGPNEPRQYKFDIRK